MIKGKTIKKKQEKYQICVMERNHSHIVCRSAIQSVCSFDVHLFIPFNFDGFKSLLLKKCFSDLNLYEAVTSSE